MHYWLFPLFILFLCWGSFLNVLGYRIIRGYSLTKASFCRHCRQPIAWYDLIPVVSYCALWGRCRSCGNRISMLYPFIELLTAVLLTSMVLFIASQYWFGYGLFISANIVTIRTDFEKMLISRLMTLFLIPLALLLATFSNLPLTPSDSIMGAVFGFAVFFAIARIFYLVSGTEGLGDGDLDLMAMIGSFTGLLGALTALTLGSFFGTIASLCIMAYKKRIRIKIAFGPWLIAGAFIYIFFKEPIDLLFSW